MTQIITHVAEMSSAVNQGENQSREGSVGSSRVFRRAKAESFRGEFSRRVFQVSLGTAVRDL